MIICSLWRIDNRFVQFLLCGIFGVIALAFYAVANAARNARLNRRDDEREQGAQSTSLTGDVSPTSFQTKPSLGVLLAERCLLIRHSFLATVKDELFRSTQERFQFNKDSLLLLMAYGPIFFRIRDEKQQSEIYETCRDHYLTRISVPQTTTLEAVLACDDEIERIFRAYLKISGPLTQAKGTCASTLDLLAMVTDERQLEFTLDLFAGFKEIIGMPGKTPWTPVARTFLSRVTGMAPQSIPPDGHL